MYMMSTFEHSTYLELALSSLEMENISKENILAVPLDNRPEHGKLFDTIHRSDGVSLIDLAASVSTAFSVIGASIGFQLAWGPIVWGIIGAIVGFAVGFLIDLWSITKKRERQKKLKGKKSELILIVYCDNDQEQMVEKVFWDNFALGVAKMDNTFSQA